MSDDAHHEMSGGVPESPIIRVTASASGTGGELAAVLVCVCAVHYVPGLSFGHALHRAWAT